MTVPLYSGVEMPERCDGHYGLWFERFADFYESDFSILKKKMIRGKEQSPSAAWLQKHFKKKVGDNNQLSAHVQTQLQLVKNLGGECLTFKAGWHFVTGMGNPHPVENGFSWHPTLGVPYLTGTAVKGLARGYIEQYLDTSGEDEPGRARMDLLLRWFGSTDKDPLTKGYQAQAGELIFFDALPLEPVQLGVDVMTPHMGKWYADGGKDGRVGQPDAVPADWHDPVPISFLVAKDISLFFSFALRPHSGAEAQQQGIELSDVIDVLVRVLDHQGAGAKTSTGYGGFERDESLTIDPKEKELNVLLESMFEEVKKENHLNTDQQALVSKPLAQKWEGIQDAGDRSKILVLLTKMWTEAERYPSKKAQAIYGSQNLIGE